MKKAIGFSFIFLGAYALCALTGMGNLALLLFSLSPLVVIYLCLKILRDDEPVKKTFDESFYQDFDYRRNRG